MAENSQTIVDKITSPEKSVKVKDPKRVAAGKKLAEISKAAKEKKMRERLDCEEPSALSNYGYVIGTLGVIFSGVTLWYTMRRKEEPRVFSESISKSVALDTFDS